MASVVGVCNSALQKLGSPARITSLSDNSPTARALSVSYESVRDKLLRASPWNFAIKRAQLAASATDPLFTKDHAYPLPSDFLRLLPTDPEDNANTLDWQIESGSIVTNDDAPLEIRYIWRVTDPNAMDVLFLDLWAVELALQLCYEITGSNQKKAALLEERKTILREAKRVNAIESEAPRPPDDTWITARA